MPSGGMDSGQLPEDTLVPHQQPHSLLRRLEAKRAELITAAEEAGTKGEYVQKLDYEKRAGLIRQSLLTLRRPSALGAATTAVFVSYSKSTGGQYVEILREHLVREGFSVVTGFDPQAEASQSVLHRVMKKLRESSFFVGLLTKEYRVAGSAPHFAPSVWVVEEKGMALYRSLPCYFLVEQGIHEDWLAKTTPGKLHYWFTAATFAEKAQLAVQDMKQKHATMRERFMS